jgi:predicted metal-dependent phosphoesterase TrpH
MVIIGYMFADLHLHSIYSDGTDTPDGLISLAITHKISVVAISDHDSISAYNNITNLNNSVIKLIPAVEISTVLNHNFLHVLGYYINIHSEDLFTFIKEVSNQKTENTRINFENAAN